jgi:hypothetical protein
MKKILSLFALIVLIIVSYHYLKPPFELENSEAKKIGYKVRPFRDSIYIYIPYKITLYNNRLESLKIIRILDENSHNFRSYLLFNMDGIELASLHYRSKEQYGDQPYWPKAQYRATIFPLTKRTFYYYRKHKLHNKHDIFGVKKRNKDSIYKQLSELKHNFCISNKNSTIDSLYKTDHLKIFNIGFETERSTRIKYVKGKINSAKQIAVNIDLFDSIPVNLSRAQQTKHLMELMIKTSPMYLEDF